MKQKKNRKKKCHVFQIINAQKYTKHFCTSKFWKVEIFKFENEFQEKSGKRKIILSLCFLLEWNDVVLIWQKAKNKRHLFLYELVRSKNPVLPTPLSFCAKYFTFIHQNHDQISITSLMYIEHKIWLILFKNQFRNRNQSTSKKTDYI